MRPPPQIQGPWDELAHSAEPARARPAGARPRAACGRANQATGGRFGALCTWARRVDPPSERTMAIVRASRSQPDRCLNPFAGMISVDAGPKGFTRRREAFATDPDVVRARLSRGLSLTVARVGSSRCRDGRERVQPLGPGFVNARLRSGALRYTGRARPAFRHGASETPRAPSEAESSWQVETPRSYGRGPLELGPTPCRDGIGEALRRF